MNRPKSSAVWRDVDGLLLLDKPRGISSNEALQQARRLFAADKGGHTGSLDPLATGMLPLCFGESTKIAGLLLSGRKCYETLACFGSETDSADADGQVVANYPLRALDVAEVKQALDALTGRIRQVPPVYSAIKVDGEPLYRKARRGEAVEVPEREVEVHEIELLSLSAEQARLRIVCGAGTYVRSLVRDLGAALGVGAHVVELRRLWVDPFRDAPMFTLEQLQAHAGEGHARLDALLLPVEAGLGGLPSLELDAEQARMIGQGQSLESRSEPAGDYVARSAIGRAIGFVAVDASGRLVPRKLFRWAVVNIPKALRNASSPGSSR